ncbi:hypothetical protein [Sporosarcina aquimarina]|uniref:Uncharacterized protein n=1 Tax=Sporosarcina aquimarina TaxID=114975 RepID=A0ABU4G669_9BACL|nr:hypothetical protein [Sporosarcina aquimarina]MDW0111142.1 hypothetical protein [Sporosarcina aquimarina]
MEDKSTKRLIASAGAWFVGEYAAVMIERFTELESNKRYKSEFIEDIYNSLGRDRNLDGTSTRVNAVLRIIRSNKIVEALEYVIQSDRMRKDNPGAVRKAKETLNNIK